jgi:hypothetical protein
VRVLVLTVDQRASRRAADAVPDALTRLQEVPTLRPFERTVGDELQGVVDQPDVLPQVVEPLLRDGTWHIGVGAGEVEGPLPEHARAGRGAAYLRARDAVTAAKTSPWHLRIVGDSPGASALESACWLWAAVLARRTPGGWEVADLVDDGHSYEETARRLGITQSAVSQRAQAAHIVEGRRARELVTHLAGQLLASPGEP